MVTSQRLDASRVKTPTQLIAATIVLTLVVVPAFVAGAASITEPSWLAATFGVAAVVYLPVNLVFIYRLLTRHRMSLLNDDVVSRLNAEALNVVPRLDRSLGN